MYNSSQIRIRRDYEKRIIPELTNILIKIPKSKASRTDTCEYTVKQKLLQKDSNIHKWSEHTTS